MNYRNPKVEDAEEITKIAEQVTLEDFKKKSFDFDLILKHTKKNIQTFPSKYSFVAEEDGKVIGYVFTKMEDLSSGQCPFIVYFGVSTEYRRKGIGTKLMNLVIDMLEKDNFKKINLAVTIHNKAAIDLYEKLGFKKNKYLMKKVL